jgi:hypothetical protein
VQQPHQQPAVALHGRSFGLRTNDRPRKQPDSPDFPTLILAV